MYDKLRTIEFLGHNISKNEIVSNKLLSFLQQKDSEEIDFGPEVTAGKRSQCECFLEICKIWLNYV